MSQEELNAYISAGIFENKVGWYTLIQIQAVEHPDQLSQIPGYVTANGTDQAYWLLLCTEDADVRPTLARILEQQKSGEGITVYLQCHTDLSGFYQRYSDSAKSKREALAERYGKPLTTCARTMRSQSLLKPRLKLLVFPKHIFIRFSKPKQAVPSVNGCKNIGCKKLAIYCAIPI